MASGIIGVCLIGHAPWWMCAVVLVREILVVGGGAILLKCFHIQIPVVYAGKIATTFLFVGFTLLLIGWPTCQGIGVTHVPEFPGFNFLQTYWGIWVVYVGLLLQAGVTVYYFWKALQQLSHAKAA